MKRNCGCLAMASPNGKSVWARTPKIWRTFCEIKYSTTVSARLGPDRRASSQIIGLSNSRAVKKQPTFNGEWRMQNGKIEDSDSDYLAPRRNDAKFGID